MAGNMNKASIIIALLIMTVGIGWLLNTYNVIPDIDWIWTLGLAISGILTLALGKFDRLKFVVGLFLVVSSLFSVLRQTGRMGIDVEIPWLVIILGALMLLAQFLPIASHSWPDAPKQKDIDTKA